MSKIVTLKSRTYIPKLLNLNYNILVISNFYIKFILYKISIFETYKPSSLIPQTNLFLKSISLKHLYLNSSYDR